MDEDQSPGHAKFQFQLQQRGCHGCPCPECAWGQEKRKGTQDPKTSDEEEDGEMSEVCEDVDVFKAETLSEAGGLKSKPMEKIDNMHRLLTKLLKEAGSKAKKVLVAPTQKLDKMKAMKKVPKLEELKSALYDSAIAVKQCKKLDSKTA